jgi:hypothetical protein
VAALLIRAGQHQAITQVSPPTTLCRGSSHPHLTIAQCKRSIITFLDRDLSTNIKHAQNHIGTLRSCLAYHFRPIDQISQYKLCPTNQIAMRPTAREEAPATSDCLSLTLLPSHLSRLGTAQSTKHKAQSTGRPGLRCCNIELNSLGRPENRLVPIQIHDIAWHRDS